jgi:hypothetical protein
VFHYCVSGLTVASDVALPGLIEQPATGAADVQIVRGDVPETLDGASEIGPNWRMAGDAFLMNVPDVIRMLLTAGCEIRYTPADGVAIEEAAIFISGTGFGILLHQRGRVVLHASAVRVGNAAVLFCGPSGAGKSTLAAALGERGYDLVTDDFCGVAMRDGRPWIEPDARQHKLWQQAIDALEVSERRADAVRTQLQKYYVEPRGAVAAPLPVAAIYQLRESRPPHEPGISTPNIIDAALIVRRNAYRPQLVQRMGQRGLYFESAAALAQTAGIFILTRRLGFPRMSEAIDSLEEHWAARGLTERAA